MKKDVLRVFGDSLQKHGWNWVCKSKMYVIIGTVRGVYLVSGVCAGVVVGSG